MRIKWLEINGFKSFPERIKMELNEGITCFVGPNGAGKSNIVDAFRWVLGEHNPRTLRGEKMEEVIFQGSQAKKEKGMAEVTISLKSQKESENGEAPKTSFIEIKRRFYRTGESYFIINGKQARLKDIKEIFLSEGVDIRTYSIIDQIKINEILSKPSHRKTLLEECAGISLYKLKKTESEGKLQLAKENLQRIQDIISELKKQYLILERQAKKAERYRKIVEELKNIELKVSKTESLSLLNELEVLKTEIRSLENKQSSLKEENSKIIEEIKHQKSKISEIETFIHDKQNQLKQRELEKAKTEKEFALICQEEQNKKEAILKLQQENFIIHKEIEKSQTELKDVSFQSNEIEESMEILQTEIINEEQSLLNFHKEITELEKDLEKQRKILFTLTTELANKRNYYQSLKKSTENAQNRINSLYIRKKEIMQRIKQMEKEINSIEIKTKTLKETLQLENSNIDNLQKQLIQTETGFEEKSQKLIEKKKMEAMINGKIEALATEIWEEDRDKKLFFECIDVRSEAEEVIETLLDEKLRASVIEDIEEIKNAQNRKFFFLKNNGIIENRAKLGNNESINIKKINDFIRIKEEGINEAIFENVFIVTNLKEALEIKKDFPSYCFVTIQGEVVFPDGFIKTGKSTNLLKKKRILEYLKNEKTKILNQNEILEQELENLKKQKEELKKKIEIKRVHISQLNKEIFYTEEKYKSLLRESAQTKQRLKYMEDEERALKEEINQNKKLQEKTRSEIEQLSFEIEGIETKIEEFKNKQKEITSINEEKKEVLSDKKIKLSTLKERLNSNKIEITRLNEEIKKFSIKKKKNEEEIEQSKKIINKIEQEKTDKLKKIEDLSLEINGLKEQKDKLVDELQNKKNLISELEKNYQMINEQLQSTTAIIGDRKTFEGEKKFKLENIWNEINTLYGIDIIREKIEPTDKLDILKSKAVHLKNQLKDIGPVDIEILREYEEVKERYNFLINQQKDIITSIEELEEAIKKISSITRKRLRETFSLLKEKFNSLFNELFDGGKAELILTDENNILESEIEIQVQPPGKKVSNINLLSGGEKALTALTFIFACLSIRSSPICILDEVDAQLDDPNTLRLRKFIKELSNKIQFLIITHNKLMMEIADYIYGVTMQKEGVSMVISLQLKEAEVYT